MSSCARSLCSMSRRRDEVVEIRRLGEDDVPALIACTRRCYGESYPDRLLRAELAPERTARAWEVRTSRHRLSKPGWFDECHLFIWPVVLGGGKPALPSDMRAELALLDERRFSNSVVH